MNRTYQQCQYLALGLLVGYLGLYAIDWLKSLKVEKTKNSLTQNSKKEPITNV